jgi:hypothetical protein
MSWFKDFFTSGVSEVISSAGEAIDRLVTSDEERDSLKIELEKELNKFKQSQLESAANYDKEISQRHLADMTSDSWLSKNIRPLALSFLTISTVLLAYLTIFILDVDKISLIEPWLELLQLLLVTTYAFYFGSRGFEKIQKIKDRSNK